MNECRASEKYRIPKVYWPLRAKRPDYVLDYHDGLYGMNFDLISREIS